MSHRRILCCALTLLLSLAMASCASGASGTPSAAGPTATSSVSAASMATAPTSPTPWPTVTPDGTPCADLMSKQAGVVRTGDLLLGPTFTDPEQLLYQLPDGTPLEPLKLPQQNTSGRFPGWPVSTLGASSVYTPVCNASATTAHRVEGMRVKLTGFTAYSAQLNEWDYCAGSYARPAGVAPNNCDRGMAPTDEMFGAVFAANAPVGTIVTGQPGSSPIEGFGPLPAVLPPGIVMYLHVAITVPAARGTYSFAVSVTADGTQLPFTSSASMLLAPVAHIWNGQACTTSSMLAQIPPATNPPTPYICPVS